MGNIKITDLVDENEIQKLKDLGTEIEKIRIAYSNTAKELSKGFNMDIEGFKDLEKLNTIIGSASKNTQETTGRLNVVLEQQSDIISRTTNTISRELAEIEKENAKKREALQVDAQAVNIAQQILGFRIDNISRLSEISTNLSKVSEAQKKLNQEEKKGAIDFNDALKKRAVLIEQERTFKAAKQDVIKTLAIEEKMSQATLGSYEQVSQQLELMKRAYKQMTEEEKNSGKGKILSKSIQETDSHLKDLSSGMGEFQRSVGNYAIAAQKGAISTEEIERALRSEAKTIEEAEEQNRLLAKAINQVDITSDKAVNEIESYSKKIDENTKTIKEAKGESDNLVDSIADVFGINTQLGSSLEKLSNSSSGGFFDGLNTKVRAFGKTLLGLLANPAVLTFLGIGGTVMAFKWWYDYNKGLVEATKLTKDFTGASGDDLKIYRNEVQALADMYDKDFREVLISVNAVSKQFGVSFSEAMSLVKDGFVSGADANGEFLDNLKEYPAYFKEAGISAEQFIAITTQTNKQGIYSDKAVDVIKEGNIRIREMTKATADALNGIGLSSKKVQKDLQDGSKTTFDIIQEVSSKLAEFPESSSAVGTALADIFGGPGEDAGLQYIKTLKDIDTNLDNVKAKTGTLGELQEEQLRSQIELENTISAVFDMTGGSFEKLTTRAKIFVNDGLVWMINKIVDVSNWFIRLYNNSKLVNGAWNVFVLQIKNGFSVISNSIKFVAENLKGLAGMIEGAFTLDWDKFSEGWKAFSRSYSNIVVNTIKDVKKNAIDTWNSIGTKIDPISVKISVKTDDISKQGNDFDRLKQMAERTFDDITLKIKSYKEALVHAGKEQTLFINAEIKRLITVQKNMNKDNKTLDELKKEAEERKNIIEALQESEVDLMDEGYMKQIASIRANYAKKIAAIKGYSKEEKETRANLTKKMQKELEEYESAYNEEREKLNLSNKLEAAKKGSQDEYDVKLKMLEREEKAEIKAADKTGEDILMIRNKYQKKHIDLDNEYASSKIQRISEDYATDQTLRDSLYIRDMSALKKRYEEERRAKGNNEKEQLEVTKRFKQEEFDITSKYVSETARSVIDSLEQQLKVENLTDEQRTKLNVELQKAKADLADKEADAEIEAINRVINADKEATEKKKKNLQQWVNTSRDAMNTIIDFVSTLYDGQINSLEREQEANDESYDRDIDRIEKLAEKGVITEEEAESRKRAAQAKTEAKAAELEKKKADLQYKQAVWNKSNSIAQAGIATALAITEALPNIILAAIVGAMGALQVATILATPIPSYAKGTDSHIGGPALVGDAGKHEVVIHDGKAWITPDTPTIVDIPEGAQVLPDFSMFSPSDFNISNISLDFDSQRESPKVVVNNDYKNLEKKMQETNNLLRSSMRAQAKLSHELTLGRYKTNLS